MSGPNVDNWLPRKSRIANRLSKNRKSPGASERMLVLVILITSPDDFKPINVDLDKNDG